MSLNLNQLAKDIAEIEGQKVQVNIAQIKEVLRCLMDELAYTVKYKNLDDLTWFVNKITRKAGFIPKVRIAVVVKLRKRK